MANHMHLQPPNVTAPSTPNSSPTPARLPENWIKALFGRFALIWPRDWASIVERTGDLEALRQEWAEGLEGMSGEQIKAAIARCRATLQWSPTIAEFRKAGITDTPEQRAFQARLAQQAADRAALPSRTWAETKAAGIVKAQVAKAMAKTASPARTRANIANGTWTREMESRTENDYRLLGIAYQPLDWPDAPTATDTSANAVESAQEARSRARR